MKRINLRAIEIFHSENYKLEQVLNPRLWEILSANLRGKLIDTLAIETGGQMEDNYHNQLDRMKKFKK